MSLLFPNKCILCGKALDRTEMDLCRSCRVEAPECPVRKQKRSFLDSWVAIWYYKGYIRSSILRYKFGWARHYAHGYGRILAMKLAEEYPDGFDTDTSIHDRLVDILLERYSESVVEKIAGQNAINFFKGNL